MATHSINTYPGFSPEIQSELLPGESLLWTGQPLQSVIFHPLDIYAVPFSLLWGGFAIFWEWGVTDHFTNFDASSTAGHSFLPLWGIPFILIGQYLIWGRFLVTAWRKERTFYAVTNKRVLIVSTGLTRKVIDGNVRTLSYAALTTRSDGIGTIKFTPDVYTPRSRWSITLGTDTDSYYDRDYPSIDIELATLAFHDIPDARAVYQLIQSRRDQA